MPEFLTPAQAADALHVSRPMLYETLLDTGKLASIKRGNRRWISAASVQALIAQQTADGDAHAAHFGSIMATPESMERLLR